jgi:hypothetical protein
MGPASQFPATVSQANIGERETRSAERRGLVMHSIVRSEFASFAIGIGLTTFLLVISTMTIGTPGYAQKTPSVLAQFTTGVENREPIDQVTFVENDARKVFFFTDLRGLAGRTVLHRWIYDGNVVAEVRFEVDGPRWRVWSSKDLLPDWIGDWTVEIVIAGSEGSEGEGDAANATEEEVIAAETFTYSAPEA